MFAPRPWRSIRLARSWMRLVLRFWPAESRDWGHALAAELDSIRDPRQAIRWVLGGTLLLARAFVSHSVAWLRLPVGARLNGSVLHPSVQLPHRSRLFSAALLFVTATVLCLPQGRQALSAVKTSWGFSNFDGDVPELEKIGRRADRENDARTLAFVGLALSVGTCCPLREYPEAIYYRRRAIAIDPSLAWIYTSTPRAFHSRQEWLARLKAFDPENALPYLLSADEILEKRYEAVIRQHYPTDLELQASVENDAGWLGDVQRAIRVSRFDTYSENYLDLFKAFYRQNPSLEPSTYLLAVRIRRIPSNFSLGVYVSILVRRAEEARSAGSFAIATGELKRVIQFVEQASKQSEDGRLDQFDTPAIQALHGLKAALVKRGHTEDATVVENFLQRFDKQTHNRPISMCSARRGFDRLGRTAILLHSLGFALALFSGLFFASIVVLEIPILGQWRLRRFVRRPACLLADLCPALLVPTCVAFLYAYQPFVRTIKAQVSQSTSLFDLDTIRATYRSLNFLPSIILPYVGWMFVPWVFVCILLALLALFILVRGVFRTRQPAKA